MSQAQEALLPDIRRRLDAVRCARCVHVRWTDLWCERAACWAVEPARPVARFLDQHHVSVYGGFFVGDFLLRAYRNHTNESLNELL